MAVAPVKYAICVAVPLPVIVPPDAGVHVRLPAPSLVKAPEAFTGHDGNEIEGVTPPLDDSGDDAPTDVTVPPVRMST